MDYNTFANNLQKSGFTVNKLDIVYTYADTRCWSVVINPESDHVIVTYNINRYDIGTQLFDIFYSKAILTDIEIDDIYDTIDLITNNLSQLLSTTAE